MGDTADGNGPGAAAPVKPKSTFRQVIESPVLGILLSLMLAIVLGVAIAMLHDSRWLLSLAWPISIFAVWEITRIVGLTPRALQVSVIVISAIIAGAVLAILYVVLSPKQEDHPKGPGATNAIAVNSVGPEPAGLPAVNALPLAGPPPSNRANPSPRYKPSAPPVPMDAIPPAQPTPSPIVPTPESQQPVATPTPTPAPTDSIPVLTAQEKQEFATALSKIRDMADKAKSEVESDSKGPDVAFMQLTGLRMYGSLGPAVPTASAAQQDEAQLNDIIRTIDDFDSKLQQYVSTFSKEQYYPALLNSYDTGSLATATSTLEANTKSLMRGFFFLDHLRKQGVTVDQMDMSTYDGPQDAFNGAVTNYVAVVGGIDSKVGQIRSKNR